MTGDIALPLRADGSCDKVRLDVGRIVIIGANGAGKSRFTRHLIRDLGDKAYSISALDALYGTDKDGTANSFSRLYKTPMQTDVATTAFDRILAQLMHDEMLNLISFKIAASEHPETAKLKPTLLDRVTSLWQDIFPDSRVLVETGKVLISRRLDPDTYSALRLSDGERAVLFYAAAILYAPQGSIIFTDSPEMFLHPSMMQPLWSRLEQLRPDCRFVYTTHNIDFTYSLGGAHVVWVRDYDAVSRTWDYIVMPHNAPLSDEMYRAIVGVRKPVMFIEGDDVHSIDAKLYPLIFKQYTVKSLGSCNKVIEAVRTFNDLKGLHHNDAVGIVDRDRRNKNEVDYLRRKRIMVPNVAEIENILMLEDIIRTVAEHNGHNPDSVFANVKRSIVSQFRSDINSQALQHTRHRVKLSVEHRIDGRFADIDELEQHFSALKNEINPRGIFMNLCRKFQQYANDGDYAGILCVYNKKSMISECNVAGLCGLSGKEQYIECILQILRLSGKGADKIRSAVTRCFGLDKA